MARYIDLDDAVRVAIQACVDVVGHGISQIEAADIALKLEEIPDADVSPKRNYYYVEEGKPPVLIETKENRRSTLAKEIVSDLKKIVHDKAVHPHTSGVGAYISLKVFDAILQEYVSRLEGKHEEK